MEHPLENYRIIGTKDFFKNIDRDFWNVKYEELKAIADGGITANKEAGIIEIVIVNHYTRGNEDVANSYTISLIGYCEEIYDDLENEAQMRIDKITMSTPDTVGVFAKVIINELNAIVVSIATFEVDKKYELLKSIIEKKVKLFLARLELSFLKHTPLTSQNKIQWLGKTNLLTTLVYDLWQGQNKGKGKEKKIIYTNPLIKSEKNTLIDLLANNFLDKTGKPISRSTLSDYLSTSSKKEENKLQKGFRIELNH